MENPTLFIRIPTSVARDLFESKIESKNKTVSVEQSHEYGNNEKNTEYVYAIVLSQSVI